MTMNKKIINNCFLPVSEQVLKNYSLFNIISLSEINIDRPSYPQSIRLCELLDVDGPDLETLGIVRSVCAEIETNYDLLCTLAVYYPQDNGHIDWHTNQNFELYNAICTFSHSGNSFFEYKENNEVITVPDTIGWSVKKTKWGSSPIVPHRAVSNDYRITLTFSSENEEKIDYFINNLLDK